MCILFTLLSAVFLILPYMSMDTLFSRYHSLRTVLAQCNCDGLGFVAPDCYCLRQISCAW